MKYSEMDWGTMEAVVNKLGGMDGVQRFLRGEVTLAEPAKRWREQDGVIYFTLPPTDGTTGPEWIKRLEKKNFRLSQWATDVLKSKDFKPTTGVVNEVAVLKGMLFENSNRTTKNIRAEADKRKLNKPNAEVACLIRENFSNEEIEAMGLWYIVAMHDPIKDSVGDPCLLHAGRGGVGRWLNTCYGSPDDRWVRGSGFAFAVSQVSPQN